MDKFTNLKDFKHKILKYTYNVCYMYNNKTRCMHPYKKRKFSTIVILSTG